MATNALGQQIIHDVTRDGGSIELAQFNGSDLRALTVRNADHSAILYLGLFDQDTIRDLGLAIVNAMDPEALVANQKDAVRSFEVGDIVRVTDPIYAQSWGKGSHPVSHVYGSGVIQVTSSTYGKGGFNSDELTLVTPAPAPKPAVSTATVTITPVLDEHALAAVIEQISTAVAIASKPVEPEGPFKVGTIVEYAPGDRLYGMGTREVGKVFPNGNLRIDYLDNGGIANDGFGEGVEPSRVRKVTR